jgi:hypothetical protein
MIEPRESLPLRLARSSLTLALRLWPTESRHWGRALAAELDEIETPFEALRWASGGLVLFARASASHFLVWLKLPAGSRVSAASLAAGTVAPILPRRSRLFTAAVLVGAAAFLFLPRSREAVSTVRASWHDFSISPGDLRAVENLGARAEKKNDARTLAFASLALPHSDQATAFADRAVALDPTLVWIYASRAGRPQFTSPPSEALARLIEADSSNAFPELMAARAVADPIERALIFRDAPRREIEAALTSDPDWFAHMDRAFRAPRYDSYFGRDWELTGEVWNRERSLSPSVALNVVMSHSYPDFLSIQTYADVLIHRAQGAAAASHPKDAESQLEQLDYFGQRMTEQSDTDIERRMGLGVSAQAETELRNLYVNTGKVSESAEAEQQLEHIKSRTRALTHSWLGIGTPQFRMLERSAIFVQVFAASAAMLVLAIAFSLLALELPPEKRSNQRRRLRKAICLAVDWAPIALLASCAALLRAFQPFAGVLGLAHSVGAAPVDSQTTHFEKLFALSIVLSPIINFFDPYHLWMILTCTLFVLLLFLLLRGFVRYKRA